MWKESWIDALGDNIRGLAIAIDLKLDYEVLSWEQGDTQSTAPIRIIHDEELLYLTNP